MVYLYKNYWLLFLSSFLLFNQGQAQLALHTPSEVSRIMEESNTIYIFDSIAVQTAIPTNITNRILKKEREYVRTVIMGDVEVERRLAPSATRNKNKSVSKGYKQLSKKKYAKARLCFKKGLEKNKSDFHIINAIAETYIGEKDYGTANYWYKRSLEYNSLNIDARKGLADSYAKMEQWEKALDEILMAHLFNRTDRSIITDMQNIMQHTPYNYQNVFFAPKYQVSEKEGNKIRIKSFHPIWLAYASVHALWKAEKGYAEKMKEASKQDAEVLMEKEAVMNALITYGKSEDENKAQQFPMLELLSEVSLKRQIDNFIIYEILSVKDSTYTYSLTDKELEKLKKYILKYRQIK